MVTGQKDAFIQYEADQWFQRNSKVLKKYTVKSDKIISLLRSYKLSPKKILEIGCSAGYRLDGLKKSYPDAGVFGIEPSKEAINYGSEHYKGVSFVQGTADDLEEFADESLDLVIVGFVFYVVDRKLFLKSVSEIDRVLTDRGFLVIMDFFSETPVKRNYAHINDLQAYSFKQNYDEVFCASRLYHLLHKECYNHDNGQSDVLDEFQNLYTISLLRKDLHAAYR
jgi:ubiquinone/menaquinone biosynthesis C-methylase UbiE